MRTDILVALVTAAAFGAFYALAQAWGSALAFWSDLLFILVSGATASFALFLVRKMGAGGKLGRVYLSLFLAVSLWFIGELLWAIYEIGLGIEIPYPSFADVFYVVGYIPAIVAIYQFILVFKEGLSELKAAVAILSGLLIVGLTYVFLLDPLLASSENLLALAFDIAYPSLDAVLLVLAITMIMVFEGTRIAPPWLWVSTGVLLTAFADIAFSFGTLADWYFSGNPIELLWVWGYVAFGLGFYGLSRSFPEASTLGPA